jgi:putative transposase
MRIREIAQSRLRFGYLRIHLMLHREGWGVNRKRVHQLYRLEGLQVRMRVAAAQTRELAPRSCATADRG